MEDGGFISHRFRNLASKAKPARRPDRSPPPTGLHRCECPVPDLMRLEVFRALEGIDLQFDDFTHHGWRKHVVVERLETKSCIFDSFEHVLSVASRIVTMKKPPTPEGGRLDLEVLGV